MTQQSHFWAYTPRKPDLKETRAPQCSLVSIFKLPEGDLVGGMILDKAKILRL